MIRWKARVENVQRMTLGGVVVFWLVQAGMGKGEWGRDVRKNMYWNTMGCWARPPRLLPPPPPLPPVEVDVDEPGMVPCFSIRAHVR